MNRKLTLETLDVRPCRPPARSPPRHLPQLVGVLNIKGDGRDDTAGSWVDDGQVHASLEARSNMDDRRDHADPDHRWATRRRCSRPAR